MAGRKHILESIGVLVLAVAAPAIAEATSVTIFFDNEGPEAGITALGTTDFSFMGSTWTGGVIHPVGLPGHSYAVAPKGGGEVAAWVTFDEPVDSVEFTLFGFTAVIAEGFATAFDADDNPIESVHTGAGVDLVVRLDPDIPIARIGFLVGFIDNFTFTPVPEPTTGALVALGATALAARGARRRRRFPSTDVAHRASRR